MPVNLKRIKAERIAKGLTQEDFAKELGWTRSHYARREQGTSKLSAEDLEKILKSLGYSISQVEDFFYPRCSRKRTRKSIKFTFMNKKEAVKNATNH
ncbi:helix-turn-helix domain-containing protein [Xylocopilactobacillus apis]|uniref:HTH cro/C1-type domain-containing protein n=1 Tax=Xylocopilactobacillus apis TaxID=2932183 RepID=A0AAU9DF97_9LACO|nr:helix-turn-helix transcriptional regulator [Xylocopilactobacillus apis]BDR56911.1 hypothetical protein KIMC2_14730 [Xylocopilactobacillus apis]